ncbi:phosphoglycerate mutase [Rhizopogon vinicolor AM-OR11-026]|uniref:Phosphoglycerate mutase n=1 Tax=Rhizopogon vinicolor AM-OR11-026 TaxID=1314800 RepID=A0A1B7N6H8_9AGAM|nr:phosphoglycerate mutase [Rhizopogon vinicolor AM-OR11-026]
MLTVTLIRHGESTHNVQGIWSGCTDCPLTERGTQPKFGEQQARAVGAYFANTSFTKIYASPLPRARDTAQALLDAQPDPKPLHDFSIDLIKEQSFGAAEGHLPSIREEGKTLAAHFQEGKYPILYESESDMAFPGGESALDLLRRGEMAVREMLMPHVLSTARTGQEEHIVLVSHGLCIAAIVGGLVRILGRGTWKRKGPMVNTGWTRVEVRVQGMQDGIPNELTDGEVPLLEVTVTDESRKDHLEGLVDACLPVGMKAYQGGGLVETKNPNEAEAIAQARVELKN